MTLAWSRGKSTPSPATMRRILVWVTDVTWTGAGASASSASFFEQAESSIKAGIKTADILEHG